MARLQIVELPMEHLDTATFGDGTAPRTPFALIVDQVDTELAATITQDIEHWNGFKEACGARALLITSVTIDIE